MQIIATGKRSLWTLLAIVVLGTSGVIPLFGGHAAAVGLSLDKLVSAHQTSVATTVTSPAFTTAQTNELLVAFVGTDGPSSASSQSFSGVTGGGLTWTLRKRTNTRAGTAEIWTAVAPAVLTNAIVKGTHTGSYVGSITIATFAGADTTAQGAVGTGNAASGAPTATLTTTRAGSWVWGVGNDWDNATARTVGANQTKVDEYLASVGDTFWVQRQTNVTAVASTAVAINDSAPANDRWNLSTIEILPASAPAPDTTAPSVPTNVVASSNAFTQATVNWTAATDNVGVMGYKIFRDGVQVGAATGSSFTDTGLTANTTYSYTVAAYDAAGNVSAQSAVAGVTTPAPDTTAPSVQLTSPADGATVTGNSVGLAATATDNVAVLGVQFAVDGTAVGAEDTTAPYAVSWNSTTVTNGSHTLSATARDGANTAISTVTVIVDNPVVVPTGAAKLDPSTPAAMPVLNNVPSVTSPSFSPPADTVVYAVFTMDSAALSNTTVTSVSNTGTPLAWKLLGREYHNNMYVGGFVEVWWAYNPSAQAGITATGIFSQPTKNVPAPVGDFQIMVMNNAAADQTNAAWAPSYTLSGDTHPTATVTTTAANSQVFAAFNNWNTSEAPTPATGQSITSMVLNPTDVDGYWIQAQNTPTAIPSTVQMGASLVRANEWHGIAWEVLAAH